MKLSSLKKRMGRGEFSRCSGAAGSRPTGDSSSLSVRISTAVFCIYNAHRSPGLQAMQQLSGINVLVYYLPHTLTTDVGFSYDEALQIAAGCADASWVFSFVLIFFPRQNGSSHPGKHHLRPVLSGRKC